MELLKRDLEYVIEAVSPKTLETLLENQTDVDLEKVLHIAAFYHRVELIPLIIERGAKDVNGALYWSFAQHWNLELTKMLLCTYGADPNKGEFHYVLQREWKEVAQVFLECGAKFNPEWKFVSENMREFCLNFK